jgi:hypothetical protein
MFTKPEMTNFRTDFALAVKDLEKKYNAKIELHTISYSENEFHTKLTVTRTDASGQKKVDTKRFNQLAELFGLKASLGDSYTAKGITFTIYDLDPKKSKFPVLSHGSDGKSYKAPIEYVNMAVKASKIQS